MRYLKVKSALIIFDKYANLNYKFENRNFCAKELNKTTIKNIFKSKKCMILQWIS